MGLGSNPNNIAYIIGVPSGIPARCHKVLSLSCIEMWMMQSPAIQLSGEY